ncbi:hypothetical protein RB653_007067 [Dictyostelium firmibasis]|uniref:protein-histidine N-methyltransferase n=1 Tax=Dictyostelium firmibasis TaxID=79012 RepID=A0AAN7YUB2_9MYCE
MSFKFNFQVDDDDENDNNNKVENIEETKVDISEFDTGSKIDELPSKYIELRTSLNLLSNVETEIVTFTSNTKLKKLVKPFKGNQENNNNNNNNNNNINNDNVNNNNNGNKDYEKLLDKTDLIPGVYEGGFKLWECSIDIINYLFEEKIDLKGKRVLEIGCGHGLPGIYCLLNGSTVTFQDYNVEVIYNLTQPNVLINGGDVNKAKYISGDWKFVDQLLDNEKFDIILTSDTLYNVGSFKKLYNLISNHLESNGKCYLASKTYYFGVGGGIRKFEELLKILNRLSIKTVRDIKDGISNVREVVEITNKSN